MIDDLGALKGEQKAKSGRTRLQLSRTVLSVAVTMLHYCRDASAYEP